MGVPIPKKWIQFQMLQSRLAEELQVAEVAARAGDTKRYEEAMARREAAIEAWGRMHDETMTAPTATEHSTVT